LRIDGYSDASLTPNGYDLRIAELRTADGAQHKEGDARVPAGTFFHVSTIESVGLPSDICAQLWLRTTWIRKGVLGSFGKIDAGFQGTLTLGAFNASDEDIIIPIGERFCQMVFETLHSPAEKTYAERSGNYQGQKGITLSPITTQER